LQRGYRLPEALRDRLGKPMGRLFGPDELGREAFKKTLNAVFVVSVGDRVTETLASLGRVPDVQVVDGRENRREREPPDVRHVTLLRARNPPGTITDEAIGAVREAMVREKPARVMVQGEEDLLAIPAVIYAPAGARVYYGQPGKGIVVVSVTALAKERNRKLLGMMERGELDGPQRS
jgi:uncharacterized protein (UPF0218 family)